MASTNAACSDCNGLGTRSTVHGHCTDIDGGRWHGIGTCACGCCPPCPYVRRNRIQGQGGRVRAATHRHSRVGVTLTRPARSPRRVATWSENEPHNGGTDFDAQRRSHWQYVGVSGKRDT